MLWCVLLYSSPKVLSSYAQRRYTTPTVKALEDLSIAILPQPMAFVCNSALNACHYFHVTSGLVPDIMHDVLEGSLELCMRHLLIHLIREEKLFSLDALNARITTMNYGPLEVRNKPTEVTPTSITPDGHLKQSGM